MSTVAVDADPVEVWVREVRRRGQPPQWSVNWRSRSRGLSSAFVDHPITLPQALIWLGTKLQLEGEKQ